MADADGELTVAQRLGRALDRGLLPAGGPAEAAERLIERLERPARVALLGLPGSGKSSILNLLVGAMVVPETLRLPTIIVQHGDVSRMICTLTDGSTKILPGHGLADVLTIAPALVTLEMDLPALRVISMLEVSAGPMEAEQKRAATWASKRADIVIWCTTSYLPKEQAVWESLPDGVKDNSFMFLTKVDLLGSRDAAQAMHDRVELRAGEEFRQILSISAKQARAAMPDGGPVNREMFRDSGASAVIGAIKTRVQSGRRADMDTAELLLARHVEATELVARRFAESEEEAEAPAWTPPPEPVESVDPAPPEASAEQVETLVQPEDDTPEVDEVLDEVIEAEFVEDAPEDLPIELAVPEPVRVPEVDPAPTHQPEAVETTAREMAAEPAETASTRRRFADRIKRVANDGDQASSPMVPLKSTWKSKSDSDAPAEPEPQPVARPAEATRRPRTAAIPAPEPELVPEFEIEPEVEPEFEEDAVETPEADPVEPASEPEVSEAPVLREARPRAVTPRPERPAEPARTARPQLFGNRRPSGGADAPLPDLSSLRATPEEIAASAEMRAQDEGRMDADPLPAADQDEPTVHFQPDEVPEVDPTPVSRSPVERSLRVERSPDLNVGRASPLREDPAARAAPLSRMTPPPRVPAPAAAPAPSTTRVAEVESAFSPRAIMRERRVEPDSPPPRRERTRIAARAVPAQTASAPATGVSGAEVDLLDEAINLIVARSRELEQEVDPDGKVPVDMILDHSRETTELVLAIVSRGQSEGLKRVGSDLGEVTDLIMLMQLEKGHAPADDALTLILQLKRELETLRAA